MQLPFLKSKQEYLEKCITQSVHGNQEAMALQLSRVVLHGDFWNFDFLQKQESIHKTNLLFNLGPYSSTVSLASKHRVQ